MNEETIIEKRPLIDGQEKNKKEGGSWKHVTLGGVSGILMGAGLLYAGQIIAATKTHATEETADTATAQQADDNNEANLPVAQMHNDMSFGEAFTAARAEVGPGGVFLWHGGIYNTYTEEEWNAMTDEQKHDFALQVKPEIGVDVISTPTDANTHVVVEHHVYHHQDIHSVNNVLQTEETQDQVHIVDQQTADTDDSDVHIVGYTQIQGHATVGLDVNGDGHADVAIIDVDDNLEVSNPDLVVDRDGNYATIGEIADSIDPNMDATNEAPDFNNETATGTDYLLYDI